MDIKSFRVILKKESPSTGIKDVHGILKCQDSSFIFTPQSLNENLQREYPIKDLKGVTPVLVNHWFRKKSVLLMQFERKQVSVDVYFEPLDHSTDFLLAQITECLESHKKKTFPGMVGSLLSKITDESQKILKEVETIIQTSSQEISTALTHTSTFIREATQAANLLESFEIDDEKGTRTMNLQLKDIDEILKRAVASDKIEAMISSLMAKGMISANKQDFQEAIKALKIAREAAKNENMGEYERIAEENIKKVKEAETSDSLDTHDPHFSENAAKYAQEARDIVADWESSKQDEFHHE
ncbi:MAG: hypothetical protein ACTSR4_05200 [Candidatus Hodarchaeales archaeon]